jgi:hypothetical protein
VKESPQALRAFSDYLGQPPPRSLERLYERYRSGTEAAPPTRRLTTLKQWSTQHGWQERIAAHEKRLVQEREAEETEKRRKMREARIGVAVEMQRIGLVALREKQPTDITAPAAVAIVHEAHETQRKDMGEPDSRVEVGGPEGSPIVFTVNLDRAGADDGAV